ncbi:MAG: hypothetical protein U5N55_13015 [Cypionkella sp.]|nr:hypothetical protein [Cypionkella sp.]
MRRLMDIGFILAVALGCMALDFYIQKRDSAAQDFAFADYIALRQDDFNDLLNPPSLPAALPSELDGWSVTRHGADQMLAGDSAARADQASEIALVKAIEKLTKAGPSAGQMVGMTMTKDGTRLRVLAVLLEEAAPPAGIDLSASSGGGAALGQLLDYADQPAAKAAFDVVDGVAFDELPVAALSGDADMRMMRATLGGALAVNVITQSDDDEAIKEALQAIDFVMLNKLLNSPVVGVEDGRKTDLRADAGAAIAMVEMPVSAASAARENPAAVADAQAPTSQPAATPARKIAPAETAVFIAPPESGAATASAPCVRRAGVLICPDG